MAAFTRRSNLQADAARRRSLHRKVGPYHFLPPLDLNIIGHEKTMRIGISTSIAVIFEKRASKATLATAIEPGTSKIIKRTFAHGGNRLQRLVNLFIAMHPPTWCL